MTVKDPIQVYWQKFLASLSKNSHFHEMDYKTDGFGDSPEMANELGALVLNGIKTATCSSLWEWEAEGETLPKVGSVWIVLDGGGNPICITETIEVTIRKYNEVDTEFAYQEGEGDRSLAYWRQVHRNFFSRVLPKIGRTFSVDMPLVCERFRVIYK